MEQKHLEKSITSIKTIRDELDLNEDEREALSSELQNLEDMIDKLENGVVEIAVFGEVSSGKSALLNALLGEAAFEVGARCGVTMFKDAKEWNLTKHLIKGLDGSRVLLVDTPGINEVDGKTRDEIARDTVRDSDIILFVVKGDLTETEFHAIKGLHALNKPIVVAINKVDVYRGNERKEILTAVNEKLAGIVKPQNIIETAGEPKPVMVIKQRLDGTEEMVQRKVKPLIEELQLLILNILDEEGKSVVALNAALFGANVSDRIIAAKLKFRKRFAEALIKKYALWKGAVIALNPIPIADILGGTAVDATMITSIGKVYGFQLTVKGSQALGFEILKGMGILGAIEGGTYLVSLLLKLSTFNIGKIVLGIPEGCAGAWGSYVVGKACHEYFAHGASWGEKGAKSVVRDILANMDKESILDELKDGITNMLKDKKQIKESLKRAKDQSMDQQKTEAESKFEDFKKSLLSLAIGKKLKDSVMFSSNKIKKQKCP